jgi:hypothetical protein
MAKISKAEMKKIRAAVEKEFPNDPALQQVHAARKILSHKAKLEGLTFGEYIMQRNKRRTEPDQMLVMEGVQYLIDARGRKKAVVIDLDKHGDIWEDFHDILVVRSRKNEPRVSLKTVQERSRRRVDRNQA